MNVISTLYYFPSGKVILDKYMESYTEGMYLKLNLTKVSNYFSRQQMLFELNVKMRMF